MLVLLILWLTRQTSVVNAELPSFFIEANISYLTTGDTVVIKCRLTKTSLLSFVNEFSIHWWKDDVKLTESSMMLSQDVKDARYSVRLQVEGDAVASILQITNVTNDDDGSFKCEVNDRGNSSQRQAIMITVNGLLGTMIDYEDTTTYPLNLNSTHDVRAVSTKYSQESTLSTEDSSQFLPNTTTPMGLWSTSSTENITMMLENVTLSNDSVTFIMRNQSLWNTTPYELTTEANGSFHLTTEAVVNSTIFSVSTIETSQNSDSSAGSAIALTIVVFIVILVGVGFVRKKYRDVKQRTAPQAQSDCNYITSVQDQIDSHYENKPQRTRKRRAAYEDANETGFLTEYEIDRPMKMGTESPKSTSSTDYSVINKFKVLQYENNVLTNDPPSDLESKLQLMNSPSASAKPEKTFVQPENNQKRKERHDYERCSDIVFFLKEYTAK